MLEEYFSKLEGFDWDHGNSEKNSKKHNVSIAESEQVFFNQPILLADDDAHSGKEKRFFILGKTDTARLLFVVFTLRNNLVRVVSARPMSKEERKIYETL